MGAQRARQQGWGGVNAPVERRSETEKKDGRRKAPTPSHPSMNLSVDPAKEKKDLGPGAPHRPGSKGIPIRSKCRLNVLC